MRRVAAVGIGLMTVACAAQSGEGVASMSSGDFRLSSDAFTDGGAMPIDYTCDGDDLTPPLAWSGAPEGTGAFALIVHDPDAGGFVHWVLVDIAGDATGLPEGTGDTLGTPGRTDFGTTGWGGPCPPSGDHRYVFTLSALRAPLGLSGAPTAAQVRSAMAESVLAEASLTGLYGR